MTPIAFAATLAACTQAPGAIKEFFTLGNDRGVLTGAKSRAIISQDPSLASRPGAIYPRRLTCTEPHPDVAAAVASSFGVGLSILSQGAGSISDTQAEGIAQIAHRTVSIQTLQRLMFRACEAYANGAITGTSYSLLLSEINKTMVTLVLAETAGGRFGAKGAAIGGKSSSDVTAKIAKLTEAVDQLKKDTDNVAEQSEDLKGATENQQTAAAAAAAANPDTAAENPAVQDANKTVEKETDELKDASDKLSQSASAVSKSTAEITAAEGLGAITSKPDAAIARVIADMQANFLASGDTQNYIAACLVELGLGSTPAGGDLLDKLDAKNLNELINSASTLPQLSSEKVLIKAQIKALAVLGTGESNKIDTENAFALIYRVYHLNRKTGLYQHCKDNLEPYLITIATNNNSVQLKELEVQKAWIEAAKAIAVSKADSKTARFAFCNIQPTTKAKEVCLATLIESDRVSGQKPATPAPQPKPKISFAEVMAAAQKSLETLKGERDLLNKEMAHINGDEGTIATTAGIAEAKVKEKKKEAEFAAFKTAVEKLTPDSDKVKSDSTTAHGAANTLVGKKSELDGLISNYNTLDAQISAEKNAGRLKVLKAEQSVARAKIENFKANIDQSLVAVKRNKGAILNLLNRIATHNKDLAAFKKSVA